MSGEQPLLPPSSATHTACPRDNDVLYGRGAAINAHPGNKRYRQLLEREKRAYLAARELKRGRSGEKRRICSRIVDEIRNLDPPGCFLTKDPHNDDLWYDVGDEKAKEKVSQAMRDLMQDGLSRKTQQRKWYKKKVAALKKREAWETTTGGIQKGGGAVSGCAKRNAFVSSAAMPFEAAAARTAAPEVSDASTAHAPETARSATWHAPFPTQAARVAQYWLPHHACQQEAVRSDLAGGNAGRASRSIEVRGGVFAAWPPPPAWGLSCSQPRLPVQSPRMCPQVTSMAEHKQQQRVAAERQRELTQKQVEALLAENKCHKSRRLATLRGGQGGCEGKMALPLQQPACRDVRGAGGREGETKGWVPCRHEESGAYRAYHRRFRSRCAAMSEEEREAAKAKRKARYRRENENAKQNARRAAMTKEEREAYRTYHREWARARKAAMSKEEREAAKAKQKARWRFPSRRAAMSEEQREVEKAKQRAQRAAMTEEEREAERTYHRERARARKAASHAALSKLPQCLAGDHGERWKNTVTKIVFIPKGGSGVNATYDEEERRKLPVQSPSDCRQVTNVEEHQQQQGTAMVAKLPVQSPNECLQARNVAIKKQQKNAAMSEEEKGTERAEQHTRDRAWQAALAKEELEVEKAKERPQDSAWRSRREEQRAGSTKDRERMTDDPRWHTVGVDRAEEGGIAGEPNHVPKAEISNFADLAESGKNQNMLKEEEKEEEKEQRPQAHLPSRCRQVTDLAEEKQQTQKLADQGDHVPAGRLREEHQQLDSLHQKQKLMQEAASKGNYVLAGQLQKEIQWLEELEQKRRQMHEAAADGDYVLAGRLQEDIQRLDTFRGGTQANGNAAEQQRPEMQEATDNDNDHPTGIRHDTTQASSVQEKQLYQECGGFWM